MSPRERRQHDASGGTISTRSAWMLSSMMGLSILIILCMMMYLHVGFATKLEKMTSGSPHKDSTGSESSMPSYKLATHESLGFFTDITDEAWLLLKKINHRTRHHALDGGQHEEQTTARAWYQTNWNEDFSCLHQVGVGGLEDGHKFVCDPHRFSEKDCLVYSFGSNKNFDFEQGLNELAPHCEIHIFDPTDYSEEMLQAGVNATYHAWGLVGSSKADIAFDKTLRDKVASLGTEEMDGGQEVYKTLQETLAKLGHVGRRMDIFKIDCEGCEWITYRDWISNSEVDIRQIAVEVHWLHPYTNPFFQDLHDQNYVIFHKEPNIQHADGNCVEFSFLKLHGDFFKQDVLPS